MSPAALLLLVQGIQAAIAAAPQVLALVKQGKDFIATLFSAGVISKEQQDKVHSDIDTWAARVASGNCPPEMNVEPDPV